MLLTNARVIDGTGDAPRSSARRCGSTTGRIVAVDAALDPVRPLPRAAFDLQRPHALPGLIDAHAHLSSDVFRSPGFGPPPRAARRASARPRARLLHPRQDGPSPAGRGSDHRPRRRQLRRRGDRFARGGAARHRRGAAHPVVRADPLGHAPGRRDLHDDVPRGRRRRRDAQGGARAAAPRRRLHQADGDRRALGPGRGSRAGADDARRAGRDRRRGPPARCPRGRPRRGARGRPARGRRGRRHDRARPVAPPRACAARRDGRARHRARADAEHVPRPRRAVHRRLRARRSSSRPSASARRLTRR